MASKIQNMPYENKKQETTEIVMMLLSRLGQRPAVATIDLVSHVIRDHLRNIDAVQPEVQPSREDNGPRESNEEFPEEFRDIGLCSNQRVLAIEILTPTLRNLNANRKSTSIRANRMKIHANFPAEKLAAPLSLRATLGRISWGVRTQFCLLPILTLSQIAMLSPKGFL
ncbi:hypothetical protein AAG570_003584 [Ranatra chinensis]|uniref:Uncharacterized protein n=1 Tax=Ranatra chinensis TaxID=642074 RepID=A0ABD0Y6B8_9HEMI